MSSLNDHLNSGLAAISDQGLRRQLRVVDSPQGIRLKIDGHELINYSSNDYLGLANHPNLKEATIRATETYGAGSGASRLVCGSLKPFHELEEALAYFKQSDACLTFSTGYAAVLGTITALINKDDIVIIDKLVHASIVDAARLSAAKLRVFKHNDLDDLERILKWSKKQNRNVLIITESVFSMDGDLAPLQEIVELKEKFGAWLMVDEAHATGLYGERRSGLIERQGVSGHVDVQVGTLGKAVGASGGYICGSRRLVEFLLNAARSFIFSTAPVPAAAAAAHAGIQLTQSNEGKRRCEQLWSNVHRAATALNLNSPAESAILPILIGNETEAVSIADALRDRGFFVPAIRYPTVARGTARLRLTLSADHTTDQIDSLAIALKETVNHRP